MTPLPPLAPDLGPFSGSSTVRALNCVPIQNGWGPIRDLTPISAALEDPCVGACWTSEDGNVRIFAFTTTGAYEFDSSDGSWDDVTNSGGPYTVSEGQVVQFQRFGAYLVAVALGMDPQKIDVASGTEFDDLHADAPQAKFVWTMGNQLVLAHLNNEPSKGIAGDIDQIDVWTTGTNNCREFYFPDGGEIMGGMRIQGGCRVIQRYGTKHLIQQPSGNFVFTVSTLEGVKGAAAPYSIVPLPGASYALWDEDGFYMGDERRPIGLERVNHWLRTEEMDLSNTEDIVGVLDPERPIVWWRYRSTDGSYKLIGYHYLLDRWCLSDVVTTFLVGMATPGYSLEDLDQFGALEDLPASLDSPIWKGGRPVLGAFDADNKLAFLQGDVLPAVLQTPRIEHNPGRRTFVTGARLISDATTFSVQVEKWDFHGGTATQMAVAATPSAITGLAPFRADARLHRYTIDTTGSDDWTVLHGIDFDAAPMPAGRR